VDERIDRRGLNRMGDTSAPAGRQATIGPTTRLECGICWTPYDPALGDPVWQIPPGTPFNDLPTHWTCPNCACEKQKFLVLDD
jgi:rubredoxin